MFKILSSISLNNILSSSSPQVLILTFVNICQNEVLSEESQLTILTGKNSCFKPLIHGQINLIKFIESNKFDNVYSQILHIFVWSNQFDQILKK